MTDPQRVAVVGATGYAGFELAQLLLRHPKYQQTDILSARELSAGELPDRDFSAACAAGAKRPADRFRSEAIAASGASIVFLATPHEASLELVPQLLNAGLRVVDLSGAFRFRNPETFAKWYKLPPPDAALLAEAVYGLPELYADAIARRATGGESGMLSDVA